MLLRIFYAKIQCSRFQLFFKAETFYNRFPFTIKKDKLSSNLKHIFTFINQMSTCFYICTHYAYCFHFYLSFALTSIDTQ